MKHKIITALALLLSIVSLGYSITAQRRAAAAAQHSFEAQRADLERQITQRILASLDSSQTNINALGQTMVQSSAKMFDVGLGFFEVALEKFRADTGRSSKKQ